MENKEYDYINPSHYKKGDKQVYEMMIDIWGVDAYIKHCEMCAFKYRMRLGEKPDQPVERDLDKARWYETKAKELRQSLSTLKEDIAEIFKPDLTETNEEQKEISEESTWSERKKATFKFFDEFPEPYRSQAKDNYIEDFDPDVPPSKQAALRWGFRWGKSQEGEEYWVRFCDTLLDE